MATVGYLLSPLSWWNDLYINVPIAYALAWLVSFFDKKIFGVAMVFFYWMSNLAGLLLLHKGITVVVKEEQTVGQLRRRVFLDVILSFVYSGILALLVYTGILKHPEDYFK
ncbi:MAG: hypothetical protein PHR77_21745 [Kiritimatiellae bacterium]|nr:hypothetical protein [Kiritimatiellia bacterium]